MPSTRLYDFTPQLTDLSQHCKIGAGGRGKRNRKKTEVIFLECGRLQHSELCGTHAHTSVEGKAWKEVGGAIIAKTLVARCPQHCSLWEGGVSSHVALSTSRSAFPTSLATDLNPTCHPWVSPRRPQSNIQPIGVSAQRLSLCPPGSITHCGMMPSTFSAYGSTAECAGRSPVPLNPSYA